MKPGFKPYLLLVLAGLCTALILTGCSPAKDTASTEPGVSPGYIQVSTEIPVSSGLVIKLSCFDPRGRPIALNNGEAELAVSLLDSADKPVKMTQNGYTGLFELKINLPTGREDNLLRLHFNDFMTYYGVPGQSIYPYRKFEGKIQVVLSWPDRNPYRVYAPLRIYLKDLQPVSQKEYTDYEAVHGPSPTTIPNILGRVTSQPLSGDYAPVQPTFFWDFIATSNSYNFQIATDPKFEYLVVSETGLPNIYTLKKPLEHGHTYYWRVRGVRESGTTDWKAEMFYTW